MNHELPMRDELIERYLCVQNYYGGRVRNYNLSRVIKVFRHSIVLGSYIDQDQRIR